MVELDKLKQFYEEHCKCCGSIVCSDCWCDAADGCLYYCHEILNKKSQIEELQEILNKVNKQKTERERLIDLLDKAPLNDKTYDIADYLLEHGVIVPPCKLGTPVWRVLYLNTPDDDYYMSYSPEWVVRGGYFAYNDIENFGKTVFIDKNEAEQALKEREKDEQRLDR